MNNYKKAMGERLRTQRKLMNLTQEQLAERLDISIKHYSEAERGIIGLSVENLIKVSEILGISLDYLLKGITIDYPIPPRIIEIYNKCPDSKKRYLMEILELEAKLLSD
ncbi:MAG: helix-turn-helix transcriptional regulator [Lachnospiraceae bacterium]|nr:helix-turn-helix transcriptional regulator [Lachnospiraceae bacterium]